MIGTLWRFGGRYAQFPLAIILSWGSVVGAALMVAVQLPVVLRLLHGLHLSFAFHLENVRTVVRNFFPVFFSRGVVQISAYVDALLASLLPTGAVAALAYAQTLYTLPVSLFGMSVSAAELPAMSGAVGAETGERALLGARQEDIAEVLRARLNAGLRQIAFFVIPSVAAFLVLGDVIVAAIYQSGRFTHSDAMYVWGILAGSTVGLLASTLGRLYSSTYYALKDTRTPLRYAVLRVILTTVLGYLSAIPLPHMLGIDSRWGVAGLTISAGISSWVEFFLLRRTMNRRIGATGLPPAYLAKGWGAALAAAGIGRALLLAVGHRNPIIVAIVVLGPYGIAYFAGAAFLGLPEVRALFNMFSRMRARSS
jgi:putative peptidoglycan lipid II flippase